MSPSMVSRRWKTPLRLPFDRPCLAIGAPFPTALYVMRYWPASGHPLGIARAPEWSESSRFWISGLRPEGPESGHRGCNVRGGQLKVGS